MRVVVAVGGNALLQRGEVPLAQTQEKNVAMAVGGLAPLAADHDLLGAGSLWFGWFGFNAGSALGANQVAANAFIVTQIAAATGFLGRSATSSVTSEEIHYRGKAIRGH
jgi:ammonia channel protein AmtB